MPGLLWPAARYVGTYNPQGRVAAPLGATFNRLGTTAVYQKIGGGSTAFGWYLIPDPIDRRSIAWSPRFSSGALTGGPLDGSLVNMIAGPGTILSGPAVGTAANPTRRPGTWYGGYTTAVAANSWLAAMSAVMTGSLQDWIAADGGPIAALEPWECTIDVLTTPRVSTGGVSASLAATRIWAGVLFQNTTLQLVGGTGNTDLIYTAFPSSMAVNASSYGAMFRFSTVAADAGWVVVTANDNGAVAAQTVTPIGAIAVDTAYRLRLRFVLFAGAWQIRASINDGAETIITTNVGPGTVTAGAGLRKPIVPYVQCRTIDGVVKSLGVGAVRLTQGSGVEL